MNVYDEACPLCHSPAGEACRTSSGKAAAAHAARRGKPGSPTTLTPAQRSLRARLAAHSRWANTTADERAEQAARRQVGILDKFRREITAAHPGITEPELTRLAENARKAKMLRMSLAHSVKAAEKREHKRKIQEWAAQNGWPYLDPSTYKGTGIPAWVVEAYDKAHRKGSGS